MTNPVKHSCTVGARQNMLHGEGASEGPWDAYVWVQTGRPSYLVHTALKVWRSVKSKDDRLNDFKKVWGFPVTSL